MNQHKRRFVERALPFVEWSSKYRRHLVGLASPLIELVWHLFELINGEALVKEIVVVLSKSKVAEHSISGQNP